MSAVLKASAEPRAAGPEAGRLGPLPGVPARDGAVYRTHGSGFMLVRHGRPRACDEAAFRRGADRVYAGWRPDLGDIGDVPCPRAEGVGGTARRGAGGRGAGALPGVSVAGADGAVYRTHGSGFMLVRHGRGHAWRADEAAFRRGADRVYAGWRPDLADIGDVACPRC